MPVNGDESRHAQEDGNELKKNWQEWKRMNIIIIGNGVAGNSAASAIRKFDKLANITIISEETFPHYSACVLPNYISGELEREKVLLKTPADYAKEGVRTILGERVREIDIAGKSVRLGDKELNYDKLIIATGSNLAIPPIEGTEKEGVFKLKSLFDADKIMRSPGKRAAVIGAGFIGVGASIALAKKGWDVFDISRRWMLPRVFDEKPSWLLKEIIEEHGIQVLTGERVIGISGNARAESVVTDKRKIRCDLVVLATGLRPEVQLARRAGLEIGNLGGIKTNAQLMTSIEDIYACGDCIQAKDIVTGKDTLSLLWHNAKQQGNAAGCNCVELFTRYPGSLNVTAVDIFGTYAVSIGHTMDTFRDARLQVIEGNGRYHYYRLLIIGEILVGAQCIGEIKNMGALLSVLRRKDSLQLLERVIKNEELLRRNPWRYRMQSYIRH